MIFALTRAMPMVRMNIALWVLWRVNTSSVRASEAYLGTSTCTVRKYLCACDFSRETQLIEVSQALLDQLWQTQSAQRSEPMSSFVTTLYSM